MKYKQIILSALLDKYEKSKSYLNDVNRRIIIKADNIKQYNVENYDDKIIGPTLTRLLNIRFSKLSYVKPSVLVHLSSYGALMRYSKSLDYSYPLKVK